MINKEDLGNDSVTLLLNLDESLKDILPDSVTRKIVVHRCFKIIYGVGK